MRRPKHTSLAPAPQADQYQRQFHRADVVMLQNIDGIVFYVSAADLANRERFPALLPLYTHDGWKHSGLDPHDPRRDPSVTMIHRENIAEVFTSTQADPPDHAQRCTPLDAAASEIPAALDAAQEKNGLRQLTYNQMKDATARVAEAHGVDSDELISQSLYLPPRTPADEPAYLCLCPACGHSNACGECLTPKSGMLSCCHCGELLSSQADSPTPSPLEAGALRRAFGTRPRRRLRAAPQDDLFNPHPQMRLSFHVR